MFGDMMGKLQAMQAEMEKSKLRLNDITVVGEAENGLVTIEMTGNRVVKSVKISDDIINDKEALEDLTMLAFNRALEKADNVNNTEVQGAAKGFIPGM